ncbi:MAG: lysoplasmalogenase [Propionibacteriaceae bacterium]|jgi:uncharacterized membrane protein YhhN|nr:lysoplasmalogenase [Propionibacteriaceae bacterium]
MVAAAITVVGVVFCVINTAIRIKGASLRSLLFKTICGVFFVMAGLAAVWQMNTERLGLGLIVVLGLVLGLLGDIWLALKELVANAHDNYMYAGFAAFGLSHICYVLGLGVAWQPVPLTWLCALIGPVILPLALVTLAPKLGLNFGSFKWTAAAYGFLLCSTGAVGLATAFGSGALIPQALILGIGGISFLISDVVLAGSYFGRFSDSAWNQILCYVFYYGAQFTIALSLLAA